MISRLIYGKRWACIKPGRWRSDCGWFEAIRIQSGCWIGVDLTEPRNRVVFGDTLTSVIWTVAVREEWKK